MSAFLNTYDSPLLWLTLTLAAFWIARHVQRLCGGSAIANPTLIAIVLIGSLLLVTHTPYARYFAGAQLIHFMLGPATVALAVPLALNIEQVRRSWRGLTLGLLAGCLTSIISGVLLVRWCGGSREIQLSMAPKAVTTPIAIGVTQQIGGLASLAAVLAIAGGILVAVSIESLMKLARVRDWRAIGLAAGTAGSGIGAAHVNRLNTTAGAFAGLAIGLNGMLTALLVPLLLRWFHL